MSCKIEDEFESVIRYIIGVKRSLYDSRFDMVDEKEPRFGGVGRQGGNTLDQQVHLCDVRCGNGRGYDCLKAR